MAADAATGLRAFAWISAGAALVLLLSFVLIDAPLARLLKAENGALTEVFRRITILGEGRWYLIPSGAAVLVAALVRRRMAEAERRRRWQEWTLRAGILFAAVASTGLVVDLIKILIGRARPKLLFQDGFFGFAPIAFQADFWSFPSGHATTAGAVAVALFALWPRYWPLYLVYAAAIATSRVVITAHYLSDALFGLYLGALGSCVVLWLAERRGYPISRAGADSG